VTSADGGPEVRSGARWRQVQFPDGREWERHPENRCGACGRATTTSELVWAWQTAGARLAMERGVYCRDCGPPAAEPRETLDSRP
jgi:hypothetical protein